MGPPPFTWIPFIFAGLVAAAVAFVIWRAEGGTFDLSWFRKPPDIIGPIIKKYLPKGEGLFSTPAYQRVNIPALIEELDKALAPYHGTTTLQSLREQLMINAKAADPAYYERTGKTRPPEQHPAEGLQLATLYLKGTGILELLDTQVPLFIPQDIRFAHTAIIAPPKHGKTQTLEAMICRDLHADFVPGLVVIDSKGDMIPRLSKLDIFHPDHGKLKDKIIIVDPRDQPALNLFQVTDFSDQNIGRVMSQMDYIFTSIMDAELSKSMEGLLYPIVELLIRIEGATLDDLAEVITTPDLYLTRPEMDLIQPNSKKYLINHLPKANQLTKGALQSRLSAFRARSIPSDRCFNAPQNRLDIGHCIDNGYIVLVNAEADYLDLGYQMFGRYFIAQTYRAAVARTRIRDENKRRPAYLYIDEAAPFFDEKSKLMLNQMRSYRVGAIMAFQLFEDLTRPMQAAIRGSVSAKFVAAHNVIDARDLCGLVNADAEFVLSHRSTKDTVRWASYITEVTHRAVTASVPKGVLDTYKTMSDEAYQRLRAKNRQALQPLRRPKPHTPVIVEPKKWE